MKKSQLTFRLRQNAPQQTRRESREKNKKNQKLVNKVENTSSGLLFPAGDTAFKTLLSARFCSAIWSHISDCDETFNYWEPMHYLIFGKGLQTWEYSPEYGLRSYFYLMVHAAPAWIYQNLLQPNPVLIFYFVKCILGLICSTCEVYFYKSVCREFGVHIGRICLAFQLFAAGMFISSTSFLPSSFAMYTAAAACASWWQQKYALAIFFTALGSLLGWPFASLLGVPIAYDVIIRKKLYLQFLIWSGLCATIILVPMVIFDSMYFGRLVVAPLNIVKYNVFGGAGPNLYGTEPLSFYFYNGFVNFNIVWIFSLLSPLAIILHYYFVPAKNKCTMYLPYWLSLSPMYLWLGVFAFQEHKEERFLFPIYLLICLSAAITVDIIQKLWFRILNLIKKMPVGTHYLDKTMFIMFLSIILSSTLGVSRIFSLYRSYHAPLDLMMELHRYSMEIKISEKTQINVCFGKEWYRYPSSFFLPNQNWNIQFIKSEFNGMLPAPYSGGENATRIIHDYFNDQNKEAPELYFDVNKCNFLLDTDFGKETELEPNYSNQIDAWKIVKSYRFLNAEKSHSLFRSFYIPFFTDKYVTFGNFNLLQSTRWKIKY